MPYASKTARRRFLACLTTALCALTVSQAHAIPAPDVPNSVSPGQIEKRFEQAPSAPVTPQLQIPVVGESEISPEEQEKLAAQQFALDRVEIEGMTAYKPAELESGYSDLIGKTISLLDARQIAQKITKRYHNDGYVLSQAVVPPQDVTSGTLKIRVVEGYVGAISVAGELRAESERSRLEAYGEAIKAERPANVHTMERYLLLINDLPGVTVNGLLRPQPDETGAAELVLNTMEKRFDGSYTFDNRGSKTIGPWQHTITLGVNSLYGMYDHTQLRLFNTFPDFKEMKGFELSHEVPLGSEGTTLGLVGSHIHTEPGDSLKDLGIRGDTDFFQAKVTHPFMRARKENLLGRVLFDYRNTKTDIFEDTSYTEDRLRVLRIGSTYSTIDSLRGSDLADIQISQGLNMFDASPNGADRSNAEGKTDFTKANVTLSRNQPLPYKLSLLVAASGQYAFDRLLADEQFSIGGADYGRAFDPASAMGDHGLAGKTELAYTDTVGLPWFDYYQAYTFYDMGRTWLRGPLEDEDIKNTRASTGIGARLTLTQNIQANLEAAIPLIGLPRSVGEDKHKPRFFVGATGRF